MFGGLADGNTRRQEPGNVPASFVDRDFVALAQACLDLAEVIA